MHRLGEYELKFTSRRAWTAEVHHRDKLIAAAAPVTWIKDLTSRDDGQYLTMFLPKFRKVSEYSSKKKPFVVAVADAEDFTKLPRKFLKFLGVYLVKATGVAGQNKYGDNTVEARIVKRLDSRIGTGLNRSQKITRISFNSGGWRRPTGDAAKYEAQGTYNQENGFGHEDWLFREEWTIDGWRYAFLQGVSKSRAKLTKSSEPFDVTLFTVEPSKKRRYIAVIRDVECLTNAQAADALSAFKKHGWLKTMEEEIKAVNGKISGLGNERWAANVLNVRFRLSSMSQFAKNTYASDDDRIMQLNRYSLYDDFNAKIEKKSSLRGRTGSEKVPDVRAYFRKGTGRTEVNPEHAKMQKKLMKELKTKYPKARVRCEENYVDVLLETDSERHLFEIKSDIAPRTVLRQAIGQLLEYAFYNPSTDKRLLKLIAVGRNKLSGEDAQYLEALKRRFMLPFSYKVISLA